MSPWILILAACVDPTRSGDSASTTVDTRDGLYTLALAPDPDPPVVGDARLGIDVLRDGEPDPDVAVVLDVWMPSMGHGIFEAPVVAADGAGHVDATWVYPMAGAWEVTIAVEGPAGADEAMVAFDVVE